MAVESSGFAAESIPTHDFDAMIGNKAVFQSSLLRFLVAASLDGRKCATI